MKLTIDREIFHDKLKKVIKFVPTKTIIPAQENVLINVTGNNMEIIGGSSQSQMTIYCPVKSTADGSICLPAKFILDQVALYRENEVIITKKSDTVVEIKNGKSKGKITMDTLPKYFPAFPIGETPSEICILQGSLKMGIKSAERFIEDDSVKVNAGGLNVDEVNNKIVFTGLTNHAMCRVAVAPMSIGSWHNNVVIPEETATKLISLLNEQGEITMCQSKDKIVFFTDDTIERFQVVSVSINTKFPNSEVLFNKRGEDYVIFNTLEFKDAVMRLKAYASIADNDKRVVIETNPANLNEVKFNSVDTLTNKEGEEIMTIVNVTDKPFKKAFASYNILKIVSGIETEEFLFYFNEADSFPCFIEPKVESEEKKIFNYLIGSISTK